MSPKEYRIKPIDRFPMDLILINHTIHIRECPQCKCQIRRRDVTLEHKRPAVYFVDGRSFFHDGWVIRKVTIFGLCAALLRNWGNGITVWFCNLLIKANLADYDEFVGVKLRWPW